MSFNFSIFTEAVTKHLRRREAIDGEIIFLEGTPADSIYLVESGCVKLAIHPQDDKRLTLYRARQGDVFADDHLVMDRYNVTAIADQDTVLQYVSKELILNEIRSNPDIAMRFIECLGQRHHQLRVSYERLGIASAKFRVLHLLSSLSANAPGPLQLSGRMKSLANDLNLTPEAIYRALRELEKDAFIRRDDGTITVLKNEP
ncbi:MAG: Crp/Fnr family transcriptional regulator [Rubripirellula sp.]